PTPSHPDPLPISHQPGGAAAIPPLQGLDDADVLENEAVRLAPFHVVHAHPDEPMHLVDQFAGGGGHALVPRQTRQRAMELAVVGEKAAALALLAEAAEAIERLEVLVG